MTDTTFREVVAYDCGHKAGHDEAVKRIVEWFWSEARKSEAEDDSVFYRYCAIMTERGEPFKD